MMYAISRGPSKRVTQRRTGHTKQESKGNDSKTKSTTSPTSDALSPKLVFKRPNGKRHHSKATPKTDGPSESFTPAHKENVKFLSSAWQDVEQRLEDGEQRLEDGEQKCREPTSVPVKYSEETTGAMVKSKESGPTVNNFVPIDLDEWWAQRFLANIANQP